MIERRKLLLVVDIDTEEYPIATDVEWDKELLEQVVTMVEQVEGIVVVRNRVSS
jgi:hypothetical protein